MLPCLYFCMYVWCGAPPLTLLAPGLVLITHTFLPSSSSLCIISTPVVHALIARLFKQQFSYNTSDVLFVYLFSCDHFSLIHPPYSNQCSYTLPPSCPLPQPATSLLVSPSFPATASFILLLSLCLRLGPHCKIITRC